MLEGYCMPQKNFPRKYFGDELNGKIIVTTNPKPLHISERHHKKFVDSPKYNCQLFNMMSSELVPATRPSLLGALPSFIFPADVPNIA